MVQTPIAQGQQQGQDAAMTPSWYIMSRLTKMSDAKATTSNNPAFSFFEDALQILLPFMEPKVKADIQKDYNTYLALHKQIMSEPNDKLNNAAKLEEINRLKESFMRAHSYYLHASLTKAGVIRLEEEGEVDFGKMPFEKVQRIVRSRTISEGLDKYANPESPDD